MSVSELKERHAVATETVNNLRDRLRQRRLQLLDTDGLCFFSSSFFFFAILRSVFWFLLGLNFGQWLSTRRRKVVLRWNSEPRIWFVAVLFRDTPGRWVILSLILFYKWIECLIHLLQSLCFYPSKYASLWKLSSLWTVMKCLGSVST